MSNHTPGPWDFEPMRVNCGYISTAVVFRPARKKDFSDSEPIGQLVSDYGLETVNANARLIAAAPEMLEALQDMYEWHEIREDPEWHGSPLEQRASRAINKAKGARK